MALFINRGHYLSASTVIAELTQVDSLPGAQVQFAVCYRNGKAYSKERTLGVCRHIIRPFHCVLVVWLPLLYHVVQYGFHVSAHIGIVVLIDG